MKVGLWYHRTVPVEKYGGTERVVVWLADALAELGHDPVLLTPRGSRSSTSEVRPVPPDVIRRAEEERDFLLDPVLPAGLDVLHCHSSVRCRVSVPRITTIHGNAGPDAPDDTHVFVSRDHMERMGGRHFVHNGLDPDDYAFREEKEDWVLFLSKVRWSVKGVDRAIRIVRRAGARMVVAGGWRFTWSRRITSVGTVGGEKKRRLLAGARALLFPVRWEEPFGLVVLEAMASGTPVVASRRGSLPELVTGDVGFLCQDEEEFVEALGRTGEIDPAACARRVREAFTARRMARDYLDLYRRAMAGEIGA